MSGQESSLKLHSWPCLIKQPRLVVQAWELFAPSLSFGKVSTSTSSTSLCRLIPSAGVMKRLKDRLYLFYSYHGINFVLDKEFSQLFWSSHVMKLLTFGVMKVLVAGPWRVHKTWLFWISRLQKLFFCFLKTGEITCQCSESVLTYFQL